MKSLYESILDDEDILIENLEKNKCSLVNLFSIKDEDFTHYQDFIKSITTNKEIKILQSNKIKLP